MATHTSKLPKAVFPFIWHFLRDYKPAMFMVIFLAITAGFWGPFNSILIKHVINLLPEIHNDDASILVLPVSLIVLNFIIFDNITWRGITYLNSQHVPHIINRITGSLMTYVLGQSHQFFEDNLSGMIAKKITNVADGTEKLITSIATDFLQSASILLTSFITAYFVNPIFFFVLMIWFILFSGASLLMSKKFIALAHAQTKAESTVVGELVDTVTNQNNIRLFANKNYESVRMRPFFRKQQQTYQNTYLYAVMMHAIQGGMIAIMISTSAYFLVHLYSQHLVTVGDFALIFGLALETGHKMWSALSKIDDFNKATGKCKQSLWTIMTPLEMTDKPDAKQLECTHGEITFTNVQFNYKKTAAIFQKKSIIIKPGQRVGLVGYSGSGKSTFVNLILRLHDVTEGAICIDGQDIRDVTQDSLHQHIAMIPQDPSRFHRTLMENIRYGRLDATDQEVIEASKKAHAHEFITQLPESYQSRVGERGTRLSGGQRQRIAIAKAILKNAPILILDEATSQIDSLSEQLIQASLGKLMQNKTTLVIAHRLSTLLHMDRILVFDQGQIIEDGTHDALLLNNGLYKKLWQAQIGGYLADSHESMPDA
jgi:ATP-binding cassette subfamily B protein